MKNFARHLDLMHKELQPRVPLSDIQNYSQKRSLINPVAIAAKKLRREEDRSNVETLRIQMQELRDGQKLLEDENLKLKSDMQREANAFQSAIKAVNTAASNFASTSASDSMTDVLATKQKLMKVQSELESTKTELSRFLSLEVDAKNWREKAEALEIKLKNVERENSSSTSFAQNSEHLELETWKKKAHTFEVELDRLRNELDAAHSERRELLHQVLNLKGKARIMCRFRPQLDDLELKDKVDVQINSNQNQMTCKFYSRLNSFHDFNGLFVISDIPVRKNTEVTKKYKFDYIFDINRTQQDVFAIVEPLIKSAIDGYSACILAYGQTGNF